MFIKKGIKCGSHFNDYITTNIIFSKVFHQHFVLWQQFTLPKAHYHLNE